MTAYYGKEFLKAKLAQKKAINDVRYEFYDMKNVANDLNLTTPPQLMGFKIASGWCAKAVDAITKRLTFRGFDNDNFNMEEIFKLNNRDVLYNSAFTSALITACSFIYISAGEDGFPRLQVISGTKATGIIDPITLMLTEGYAILSEDENGNVLREAYFTKEKTIYYEVGYQSYEVNNPAPYALLVPIIYKSDAQQPFGRSRISKACMDIQKAGMRTAKRGEISAEFYSFPQKYVTGLSQDAEMLDKWKASMSALLQFDADENGNAPKLGQFEQQSMGPFIEQMKMYASMFAAETSLTLDDLGFTTGNPSSFEAIGAQHEELRLEVKKAQSHFNVGLLNVGYLAVCVRDQYEYERRQVLETELLWEPINDANAQTVAAWGDAIIKVNQAVPGYFDKEAIRNLTGIKYSDNEQLPIVEEETDIIEVNE